MFLVWCSLKIDSCFFAVKRFGFSVLAATGNESAESFDTRASIKPGTRNIPEHFGCSVFRDLSTIKPGTRSIPDNSKN